MVIGPVASTSLEYVENAVRGKIVIISTVASTPSDFFRRSLGEGLGNWNRLHQSPQISLRLPHGGVGGFAFAFR